MDIGIGSKVAPDEDGESVRGVRIGLNGNWWIRRVTRMDWWE